jgi:hypothetical protein
MPGYPCAQARFDQDGIMEIKVRRLLRVLMPLVCVGISAQAGEWELGGSFAIGQESKGTISSNGNFPVMPYTVVTSRFTGLWYQGGVHVGYQVARRGLWGLWLQGQYSEGLSHPSLYHSGENYAVGSTLRETYNGSADYKSTLLGVTVTRQLPVGEVGLSLGSRSHDMSITGRRQTQVNGTFTYDQYSVSHNYRDMLVAVSYTLTQDQGGFRSFQKISLGTGFGSSIPAVNPGPNDWRMSEAYLAQVRPSRDVRITLGVRL